MAGIIFPLAWLGKVSSNYQQIFDVIFSPTWMHILMHLALYTVFTMLLMSTLAEKPGYVYLFVALLTGIVQEGFQLLSQTQIIAWNTLFDLGVDLIGAGVGLSTIYGLRYITALKSPQG
jgi:hypothetical protein